MDEIELRRQGQVAVVTINRPEKKNCCTKAMWTEFGRLFTELEHDSDVRAVVLAGAGDNFSTGADISEFAEVRGDAEQAADYGRQVVFAEHSIAGLSKPVIAAIRGYAVGGGCGLIVCADFRVSDRSGRFGIPAAKLSIVYGMDGLQKLANIVGVTNAKKIMYTARRFTAEEAERMGLVDMLVDDDPVEAAIEFAESMAGNAPLSLMGAKMGLNAVVSGSMAETEAGYRDLQVRASNSEDYREGRISHQGLPSWRSAHRSFKGGKLRICCRQPEPFQENSIHALSAHHGPRFGPRPVPGLLLRPARNGRDPAHGQREGPLYQYLPCRVGG